MGERVLGLRSNRLSVPRALLLVNVRAAQQLVIRRRTIRLSHSGGAWQIRGPGESYSDVISRLAKTIP
jgi:hypothetical protein